GGGLGGLNWADLPDGCWGHWRSQDVGVAGRRQWKPERLRLAVRGGGSPVPFAGREAPRGGLIGPHTAARRWLAHGTGSRIGFIDPASAEGLPKSIRPAFSPASIRLQHAGGTDAPWPSPLRGGLPISAAWPNCSRRTSFSAPNGSRRMACHSSSDALASGRRRRYEAAPWPPSWTRSSRQGSARSTSAGSWGLTRSAHA